MAHNGLGNQNHDDNLHACPWCDGLVKVVMMTMTYAYILEKFRELLKTPAFFHITNMIESDIFGGHLLACDFRHCIKIR